VHLAKLATPQKVSVDSLRAARMACAKPDGWCRLQTEQEERQAGECIRILATEVWCRLQTEQEELQAREKVRSTKECFSRLRPFLSNIIRFPRVSASSSRKIIKPQNVEVFVPWQGQAQQLVGLLRGSASDKQATVYVSDVLNSISQSFDSLILTLSRIQEELECLEENEGTLDQVRVAVSVASSLQQGRQSLNVFPFCSRRIDRLPLAAFIEQALATCKGLQDEINNFRKCRDELVCAMRMEIEAAGCMNWAA